MRPLIAACNLAGDYTARREILLYTMWPRLQREYRGGCKLASFLAKLIPRPWQLNAADLTRVKNFRLTPPPLSPSLIIYARTSSVVFESRKCSFKKRWTIGRHGPRFGTCSLERFCLYGLYYKPTMLIDITARRCISAIIAPSDAVLGGLHMSMRSFYSSAMWGLQTPTLNVSWCHLNEHYRIINCDGYMSW